MVDDVKHFLIFLFPICISSQEFFAYIDKSFIRRVLLKYFLQSVACVLILLESHSFSFIQFINFLMDRVHGVIISKVQFINFVSLWIVFVVLLSQSLHP